MITKLTAQCEDYGYKSCEVIVSEKLFEPLQMVQESVQLGVGPAEINYGVQKVYAIVMGSASGDPNDCPLDF